jgi:phosphoribosylanthranilate isomerase
MSCRLPRTRAPRLPDRLRFQQIDSPILDFEYGTGSTSMRVKICGMTRAEDIQAAASAGADAIGLVFYPPSPRAVRAEQAAELVAGLPPFVTSVGLFVNPTAEQIDQVCTGLDLDLLQFHGEESAEDCALLAAGMRWIKALRMRPEMNVLAEIQSYAAAGASGVLLDAYQPGVPGGTGSTFDWSRVPRERPLPLILAGGLTPENVGAAITAVQPWAVDVSGGVEAAPGMKSADAIQQFVSAAHGSRSRNQS